jgi:hypothetical protein
VICPFPQLSFRRKLIWQGVNREAMTGPLLPGSGGQQTHPYPSREGTWLSGN